MLILKRTISPYAGADILLGVFSSQKTLHVAKQQYIEYCRDYDEYAEQAYHEVDLNNDLETIACFPQTIQSRDLREVYVLSEFTEGFGQVYREIVHVYDSSVLAHEQRVALEHTAQGTFPKHFRLEKITIDELHFVQASMWDRFRDALVNLDEERITEYLKTGFNVNQKNERGQTVLHSLAEERPEIIKRAVSLGVELNMPDEKGWTFLFYFRKYAEPSERTLDLYEWLIQQGAIAKPDTLKRRWEKPFP